MKVTDVEKLPGVKNCGLIAKMDVTTSPFVLAEPTIAFMIRGPVNIVVLAV